MNIDLTSKRALVCGSSQGIGKACAIELANLGASITLFSRNKNSLEAVLLELNSLENKNAHQKHAVLIADFSEPEQVKTVINANIDDTGGYDILINNTGGPAPGPANTSDADNFISAFSTNKMYLMIGENIIFLIELHAFFIM